jgi:hypothetical protein
MLNAIILMALFFAAPIAFARPEYATTNNVMSCTACHLSETGGGSRNVNGKLFGAHGLEINPALAQDYVYVDTRFVYYYPENVTTSKGGMGVMAGIVGAHAALDAAQRVHLVLEHNVAGFAAAPNRDVYAQFRFNDYPKYSWFEALQVGRQRVPFGIVTDEHRTYTRILTATSYFDYETGLMLSGTPSERWHYDLALVSGEKSPGTAPVTGGAVRFGTVANVRYMPGPLTLGLSGQFHDHKKHKENREALSLYSVISLARWTGNQVPMTVSLEHVRAWNWDSQLMTQGFASSPEYVASLRTSVAHAWLASADYWFSPRFAVLYKYDRLTPDRDFPSDVYDRHGIGFKWYVAPNTIVMVRTEKARATHPSETPVRSTAAQDASFAVLQLSL